MDSQRVTKPSPGSLRNQFALQVTENFAKTPSPAFYSEKFRGVTRHKRTQRFEAHIWSDKKQIYLGGMDSCVLAAKAHDIMAIKCKGPKSDILNFSSDEYAELLDLIPLLSRDDIITVLRNYSKSETAKKAGIVRAPTALGLTSLGPRAQESVVEVSAQEATSWKRLPSAAPAPSQLVKRQKLQEEDDDTTTNSEEKAKGSPALHVQSPRTPRGKSTLAGLPSDEPLVFFSREDMNGGGALTYSPSVDSLLYDTQVVNATHRAVEHILNGTVLYVETPPQSPKIVQGSLTKDGVFRHRSDKAAS